MRFSSHLALGSIAGLCLAAAVTGVAYLDQGRSEALQTAINFFAALPTYVALKLSLPLNLFWTLFFSYWVILGSVAANLMYKPHRYVLTAAFLSLVIAGHAAAQMHLERKIESAIRGLSFENTP